MISKSADPLPSLPGFEVLHLLGYGARSTIYAVADRKTKQLYALKQVLRRGPDDDRFIEQAEREYAICSQFDHPALRKSHRMIKQRKFLKVNALYLLMDLFDGTALSNERPPTIPGIISVFLKVAEGLAAMHRLGFVHADIKPNNILIDDKYDVKIIDFGQSCPVGTVKTRIQGTPDFIAPEQVERDPLTIRTDIFNMGASLYWCVTDKFIPTTLHRVQGMRARATGPLLPPHEISPAIPMALSRLVMDCIKPDPAQRPSDMNVVRARLELGLPPGSAVVEGGPGKKTGLITVSPNPGDKRDGKP